MARLILNTMISLDGVMQAPGGPQEDPSGGFDKGGWVVPYSDDLMGEVMTDSINKMDALLLGRRTYEIFAAHWPYVTDQGDPIAVPLNRVPKFVASKTLDKVTWDKTTILSQPVPESVAKLKNETDGEIQVHGSSNLIQTLLQHNLVDEFRLYVCPVILGEGKRLFDQGTLPDGLELTASKISPKGVLLLTYQAGGEVETGSFALEEPTQAEIERRKRNQGA
ncbi:MAG: dihydrofolate reductase [Dehalococcoidia bacterium]|nr:dihydrofolate reductase [Dehalococcoidia bacterium]